MAEEEKDDWLEDVNDDDESGDSELDQSDIDSLLSGDDEPAGADEPAAEAANDVESAAAGDSDADQADIDSLLSSDDDEELPETPPSQNEIDQLFSEVDDEGAAQEDSPAAEASSTDTPDKTPEEAPDDDPFKAEEIDFKDLAEDAGEDDFSLDDIGDGFDAEEFGLDDDTPDIPDIPEIDGDDATVLEQELGSSTNEDETVFLDPDGNVMEDSSQKTRVVALPPIFKNRKIQAIAGGCVALIVIGVFLFSGKPKEKKPAIAKQTVNQEQQVPASSAAPAAVHQAAMPSSSKPNTPPEVSDSEITMRKGDNELAIKLSATDAENTPLSYEILSLPEYGKLSGQAPNLIYLPNKNFTGQDSLIFRASDGNSVSSPATIKILGEATAIPPTAKLVTQAPGSPTPAAVAVPSAEAETAKPVATHVKTTKHRKLVIAARNETYHIASDEQIKINWKTLWRKANYLPYSSKIKVDIISANLHGKLHKNNATSYSYDPNNFFGGTEVIKYRFRLAKLKSKIAKIRLKIELGSPTPEIHLAKVSSSYFAGERVVLDASASRDEDRSSLLFTWKQLSGVPVQIEATNTEGSQITFVAPSSFNTINDPGPILKLIITDQDNQEDSRSIKIRTKSRRHSAIWDGVAAGGENY